MREVGVEMPSEPGVFYKDMHLYLGPLFWQGWMFICDDATGTTILLKGRKMTVESMMDPNRPGFQAERGSITVAILDSVRRRYAEHIAFHFNHRCTVQMSVYRVRRESAVLSGRCV